MRTSLLVSAALTFALLVPLVADAQQHVSRKYPVPKNVRLELHNISGEVTVEAWDRDEIKISATLESPTARFAPRQMSDQLIIDIMSDNRGRGDLGSVNLKVQVPVMSSVDLDTIRGNIQVTNVRGKSVRARVTSEGDITLAGINVSKVIASNTMGNIYFDGEFARDGNYEFSSGQGDITIRIPGNSAFKLIAAAPANKIALGQFWNNGFQTLGGGRKFVGDVGDGRAAVSVTNLRGTISFVRR